MRVGITDSTKYELKECDIDLVGKEVIVGMQAATAAASNETKNPFMPNMPKRRKGSGPGGPGGPR